MAIDSSSSSTSLAPGFRFHPTDEELVFYYLRRKICGKAFRFDAISEIDIYKVEPWDLPDKSRIKTRDMEWYFFSMLDKKYGNSQRTNRATEKGYWKTTGKDRTVYHRSNVVGMKKTLVYHFGRAPKGERTNWVMHEYRLIDEKLGKAGFNQDSAVVCRVFQKSGSGPKNGEQYGAPLIEEEWEDEDFELFPDMEKVEKVEVAAEDFLEGYDLEQILLTEDTPVVAPLTVDQYCGNNETFVEVSTGSTNGNQNCLVIEQPKVEKEQSQMPYQYDTETLPINHEYIGESSKTNDEYFGESSKTNEELDFLLDQPFWDVDEDLQFDDGSFLETNDLMNPVGTDMFDLDGKIEEFLAFSDANDDTNNDFLNNVISEPTTMAEILPVPPQQTFVSEKHSNVETQQAVSGEQFIQHDYYAASSSNKDLVKFAPASDEDCQYSFLKKASHMLGSIPAPPAFAAEFPTKQAAMLVNPTSHSSSSVHVTAGVIQISNLPVAKGGEYNFIFSMGLSRAEADAAHLESAVGVLPEKSAAALSRGWFYFMFLWVLIMSISFKLGALVCAR